MKTQCTHTLSLSVVAALLGFANTSPLLADPAVKPESEIYSPREIHHYANRRTPTVTVDVPSHYIFKTDHYVMVPRHSAEAPLPRDKYSAAYWIPSSGNNPGHWAGEK